MSSRPRRALLALAAAGSVLLSGVTLSAPAEAASQSAMLAMSSSINENVTFVAAGFVTPIKVGRRVDLQVKSGSRWQTIDTLKQDQYGGLTFSARVKRTKKAKSSATHEYRSFRMRARKAGGLKEKISSSRKVKVMLDPKVYYRVVRASVQHTEDATKPANGCGVVTSFSATRRTSSGLGRSESGKPRWKAKRLSNGTIQTELNPGLDTTWTQDLKGCRYFPAPAAACETTRTEKPSGNGKEPLGVRVSVPRSGSKGSVLFFTRGLSVGYPSADDSVCQVPWIRGDGVPTGVRTKSVSRKTLLGKKPFTIVNQGQSAWSKDTISGQPADLKLRWTESITLQRVDAKGKAMR